MSEHGHHMSADMGHEDQFEREMRGYNRRAVDEYVAALRIDLRTLEDSKRDLEVRLSQTLDESERLKLELSAARSGGKPAHEEISERIGQILKLADDEAKSQRNKADEEISKLRDDAQSETSKLRADVKAETDKTRAEAHEQAERMLSAAQEQAESTVTSAKAEADKTRKSATAEAQQVLADATKHAETAVATAKAQAKQQLDEATARATAIHDGAERRLNLLMSRHTETIRRLTEVRDVVTSLVAGETERGSLEDEVARSAANAASSPGGQAGTAEGRHASAPGQPAAAQPGRATPGGQPAAPLSPIPGQRQQPGGPSQQAGGNGAPRAAQPGSAHQSGQADATRHAAAADVRRAADGEDTTNGLKPVGD
jgi:F0F1-type ATP synthase membrane subunit b/b'